MNKHFELIRSLITYGICVPLAVFLGYCLTDPLTYSTLGAIALVAMVLLSPLFLRWHYPMMLLSWNAVMVVFFMKGQPDLWLVAVALSLGISVLQMALNKHVRFIAVPQMFWPLACMLVVVMLTARLTGGFGLRALGSEVYGAKRYIYLIIAILGYFALTAYRIPPNQARLCVKLYFLGGLTAMIGDFFSYVSPSLYFIFWIFPPNISRDVELGTTRLGGIATAATAIGFLMMALYGIRGIFGPGKSWRLPLFAATFVMGMSGGFRSSLIFFVMVFAIQFYLEGLHRTKLLPGLILTAALALVILIPLAPKLPFTMQRALSFLPMQIDASAEQDAEGSIDWRVRMWEALLPQVPKYLLLGKGYSLTPQDLDLVNSSMSQNTGGFEENMWASISGDYHNGPLSVLLTFGIWGGIAFVWFLAASVRVLFCNFHFSPPELRIINTFFFSYFIAKMVMFFFIFGSLYSDMAQFIGLVGLSVSLNGGVRRQFVEEAVRFPREAKLGSMLSRPRPAYQ